MFGDDYPLLGCTFGVGFKLAGNVANILVAIAGIDYNDYYDDNDVLLVLDM